MAQCYGFDVILVSSSLPIPRKSASFSEGGRATYSVRLFEDFEELSVERLFVDQFPADALGSFTASPCDVIGSLTSRGVGVTLKENDELIGSGTGMLDSSILRQLTDPFFSVTQKIVVQLTKGKNTVGEVELLLKISADSPDINHGLVPFGCYDVCKPVDNSINKKDIIFTLGRSGKCPTNTCITDERLMSHAGAPFLCPHMPTEIEDNKGGATTRCGCYLSGMQVPPDDKEAKKRDKAALKKLIDELGLDQIKVPNAPGSHEKSRRWHCQCRSAHSTTETSSCDINEFEAEKPPRKGKALSLTASREQQARRRIMGSCPVKEPELINQAYKPPNLCQLCQSDISWLPKISACPYCGYKTFEDIHPSEEPYDLTATAQQLLRDSLRKDTCELGSSDSSEDDKAMGDKLKKHRMSDDPNVARQCTCLDGKPCTRCRIRKLCENFFKDNECKVEPIALPQAQTERVSVTKSLPEENQVRKSNSDISQRRTQLISIFTEMRNMYGKKKKGADEADAVAQELRKECDAVCRNTKTAKARRKARKSLQKALNEIDKAYPKPPKIRAKKKPVHHKKSRCYTFLNLKKQEKDARIGHLDCISDSKYTGYCKIPCHMGWMWTKGEMARYKSWRPGAIARPIRQMMRYFLKDYPVDNLCLSRYHYLRRRKCHKNKEEEPLVQHPTLHISRNGDEYIITLRPLKDPKSLATSANPYADMKPVVFRITKDPMAAGLRQMRVALQDKGFAPCTCRRPVASCFCRSHNDKKRIQYELESLCRQRGWPNNSDSFVYSPNSDDDDSDREYEFGVTPPAGVIKPERRRKPDLAHVETQYVDHDWAAPTMYPHPANMLVQYGACVVGERKKKFPWLYGKGNIHADPPKPRMKNPPKKKPRKKLPFRNVGGYDDPSRFNDPTPLNRPWHQSNSPGRMQMY